MLSNVERMIAWRYLRARRAEGFISLTSWFAIAGIMLGVATLIVVTSLMNGIREEMTSRFIGLDGHITIRSSQGPLTRYQPIIDGFTTPDSPVVSITPKIEGQVMASAHGVAQGAQVLALPFDALKKRALLVDHIVSGNINALAQDDGVILGVNLARNLGLSIGDSITLISPQGQATFAGFIPRIKNYPVVATVKLGMHLYDSSLIVMPFQEAQRFFKLAQHTENADSSAPAFAISNLEVMVKDINAASQIAAFMARNIGSDYQVVDWKNANQTVFAALDIQRNVMVVILALIILVAAFNIISSLVMLVKEKGRGIAILRTMGMTRGSIMKIFMACGTIIGLIGTSLGLLLGIWVSKNIELIRKTLEQLTGREILVENIYFLSTLPTKTDPREIIVITAVSLLLAFLATIYPARKAAQLPPAEGLRHE